jgi:hypothetical protein
VVNADPARLATYVGECEVAEAHCPSVMDIKKCQDKLSAPTGTDKAAWCKYMQAYIQCIPTAGGHGRGF